MGVPVVKSTLATYLGAVAGIGTLDPRRLDPDDLPRLIGANAGQPYWALGIQSDSATPASFGTAGERNVFVRYNVRLEGWRGFSAANDVTPAWEALVELIEDRLQAINLAPSPLPLAGLQAMENSRTSDLRVVGLSHGGQPLRAHHALITFDILTFETVVA